MEESNSRKGLSLGGPVRALGRLLRDNTGNTMAIIAAALIPITAMIGSGVDISRAYMAKSRMQSACDAASLAARRVMKNDSLTSTVTNTGKQFFNFNFPQGLYETASFEPQVTKPGTGLISVTAETTIPTTVMRVFGFQSLPLEVSCEASLNFVNTDVVLVLDVTGSMDESVSGTKKIQALRDAVMALYDELAPIQAQLKTQGLRLRYGIVPYSGTVNVGRLVYARNPDYIRSSTPYQSRVANYNTVEYVATDRAITTAETGLLINPGPQTFQQPSGTNRKISNDNCAKFGSNTSFSQSGTSPNGGSFTATGGSSLSGDAEIFVRAGNSTAQANAPSEPTGYIKYTFARKTSSWTGTSNKECERTVTVTQRTYETRYKFTNWTYQEAKDALAFDTSTFKTPTGTITLATDTGGTVATAGSYNLEQLAASATGVGKTDYTWNGCIEERDTVSTITASSGYAIPSGAYDLNINLIPNSDATRWRPMLKEVIYRRTAGSTSATSGNALSTDSAYWACPYEARRLKEWERADLDAYTKLLQPVGGTYHDIGMIWGARLISTGGIFGDACEEYNGMPCNRHVIFMTDGAQTAYCTENVYTAWGLEPNDMRVTGAGNCPDQLARHQQRFQMICNATKNMNVSVWVVAFDTTLNASLTSCASNSSQAKTSSNRDQLIAQFREIGNQIGALRLTQ